MKVSPRSVGQSDKVENSEHTNPTHTTISFTILTLVVARTIFVTTRSSMENAIKLPVFKEVGNEDLDQFWFVIKAGWEAQGVMDDNIKKAVLVNALKDCALTWYIKHSNDNTNARITNIQFALNKEFSKPNLEA